MGATRTHAKIQVAFAYHINSLSAEWTVAVVANVYPGGPDASLPREMQTGEDEETTVEIVAATFYPTFQHGGGKGEVWENIPLMILEDMERVAIEKAG